MRLLVLAAAGCGRIGFGEGTAAHDDATLADVPAVPAAVCGLTRQPVSQSGDIDLAVAPTREGFVIVFATAGGTSIASARLDAQLNPIGNPVVQQLPATSIGGIAETGTRYSVLVHEEADQVVYAVSTNLNDWVEQQRAPVGLVGRDPFVSDVAQDVHVMLNVRQPATELEMTYVDTSGALGTRNTFTSSNPITWLSGDDGPDHGHAVWAEALPGGGSRCTASDIRYTVPAQVGSMQVISDDCIEIRNASGPPAADSMLIVWTTSAGTIESRYIAGTGDLPRVVSASGHAPKARFDGAQFWLAWLDTRDGPDELHVASFDLAGLVTDYALPGWHPSGVEAFEIVRRGTQAHLMLYDGDALTIMQLCAP